MLNGEKKAKKKANGLTGSQSNSLTANFKQHQTTSNHLNPKWLKGEKAKSHLYRRNSLRLINAAAIETAQAQKHRNGEAIQTAKRETALARNGFSHSNGEAIETAQPFKRRSHSNYLKQNPLGIIPTVNLSICSPAAFSL